MPATRRPMAPVASPLKTVSDNIPPPLNTPGKKVVALKAELSKKDAENEALRNSIAALTDALSGLNVVKDKIDTTDGTTTGVVTAAPKRKKDKDAPVPSKTAYRFWADAHPKTNEGVNMQQVWKECPPEIRQSYEAMGKADKARYQRELATYQEEKAALEMYYGQKKQDMAMQFFDAHLSAQAALEKVDAEKKGKKKAKKDPEAPKRPLSSYMYFVADKREFVTKKNPDAAPKEVIKILGEKWNQLEKGKIGKKGTKKYEDLAAEDRTRYESEKKVYDAMIEERNKQLDQEKLERLSKDKEEAMTLMKSRQDAASVTASVMVANNSEAMKVVSVDDMSVVSELTNIKKAKKVKDPNAPKKASTAYIYFCTENRNLIKANMAEGTTQKELLTEVGRQWKDLTEEKKEKYVEMTNKDKERYAKEMEKYTAEKK